MRYIKLLLFVLLPFFGISQNSTVNVNGQMLRYFVDYDSTLSTTKSWARAADGVDRFRTNPAYPNATHLYNAVNAVTGNIINKQALPIQHLHDMGITGKGIKIAMIDNQFSEYNGLAFSGGIGSYLIPVPSATETQHGTSMASIIAEKPNGYNGLVKPNGIVGIAYEAELYAYPFTNGVAEVQAAIDNKMDIINFPYDVLGYNSALTEKIQEAIQKGIFVNVACGNAYATYPLTPITFPSSVPGVFAIGSRNGGLVFANDSGRTYSSVLPSSVTGVTKGMDFSVPGWIISRDNAYSRGWTAHVGTSESVSIFTGYMALILDYHRRLYNIKLRPFQYLSYLKKHTVNTTFSGGYFQDMSFLRPGFENSSAPVYVPLPPIVSPPTDLVNISEFTDFKADLTELSSISITGSTLTADAAFVADDVGKVVVVKNARLYSTYRKAPMTLTARITAVINGDATISILDEVGIVTNCVNETGWKATNNFDVLQRAIDSCAARNKPKLMLDYIGTAYVVPTLSVRPRPAVNVASLIVNNSLQVIGIDSASTKLKWGFEDIQKTTALSTHQQYCGFWLNSASLTIKNLSMVSADRVSTRNDHSTIFAIYGNPASNTNQNIRIENSAIRGLGGYYSDSTVGATIQGWGHVAYMNSPDPTSALDTCKIEAINSTLEGQAGLSLFSARYYNPDGAGSITGNFTDTLNRLVRVWNCTIRSGAAYERKFPNVDMRVGIDTLKISHPTFSWYDYNDFEIGGTDERRLPVLAILRSKWVSQTVGAGVDSVYYTKVKSIVNDSIAIIVTTTDDNGSTIVTGDGGIPYRLVPWASSNQSSVYLMRSIFRQAAFHSTYISGTVGFDAINTTNSALRFFRNAQNICESTGSPLPQYYCRSCINRLTGLTPVLTFSEVGRQLKHILVGNTSGDYNDGPSNTLGSAPQKVY